MAEEGARGFVEEARRIAGAEAEEYGSDRVHSLPGCRGVEHAVAEIETRFPERFGVWALKEAGAACSHLCSRI